MKPIFVSLRISTIFILALFAIGEGLRMDSLFSRQVGKPSFCSASEYRQFDFWVGDWDAFDVGKPEVVARTRVERILDGCVLREDYQGANGMEGQSFSIYDASRKQWQQTWMTNRGKLLVIEGNSQDGEIVLHGVDRFGDNQLVRGTWKPMEGGVRETAVLSNDGGQTWKPWFDLMFRPHKP